MHLTLLNALPSDAGATRAWLHDGLLSLGHQVDLADHPDLEARDAAALGYALADSWTRSHAGRRLALGWVAGLTAQVATREHPMPIMLRLPRPGRSVNPAVTRVERALVRSGRHRSGGVPVRGRGAGQAGRAPVPGAGAAGRHRLLPHRRGRGRATSRPRSWSPTTTAPATSPPCSRGWPPADPRSCGTPACSATWLPTASPASSSPPTATCGLPPVALQADRMRCEAMGMAAADRAQACFDTSVAVPMLGSPRRRGAGSPERLISA